MKKIWLGVPIALSTLLMVGCMQEEKAVSSEGETIVASGRTTKVQGPEQANTKDPYKSNYSGPKKELTDPYFKDKNFMPSYDDLKAMDSNGVSFYAKGLSKEAVAGSWAGVIPWNLSSCPVADRVNIYMDDEDQSFGNGSTFSSLDPKPEGLNDNNPDNTRMIMCKVSGTGFQRLQSVNYAVFNFGDGDQSCANSGVNYEQLIDNEDGSNNNSWAGCCGQGNPDWWSTDGAYDGYVKLRVCYYPKDPTKYTSLSFPNYIGRNYGVFTEAGQDNKYVKSWGKVVQDDEDFNNMNAQTKPGFPNEWEFNSSILNWERGCGFDEGCTQGWTTWYFGKIKAWVP